MILLQRSASTVFSVLSLSDFTGLRKRLYLSQLMFNNLRKLTKIIYLNERKFDLKNFFFISVGARAVLRLLVNVKNFGQFKKLMWDKFVKKKITFRNIFCSMQSF